MEVAGVILSVVPIAASLFQSTLSLYTYYSECQDLGKTSTQHQVLLRIQRFRYQNWGEYAGLDKEDLIAQSQRYSDIDLPLTLDILAHISQLLLDASKLEKKYRSAPTSALRPPTGTVSNNHVQFESTIATQRESLAKLAQDIRSCINIASSIKFAVWDKSKLDALITQLTRFNDGLESIATVYSRKQLEAKLFTQALNVQQPQQQNLSILVSATESRYPTLAEMAERRVAYLELQERQLKQRKDRRQNPMAEDPHLKLDHTKMDLKKESNSSGRTLGSYCGAPVMVEWKTLSDDIPENENLCRIRDLAKFLSNTTDTKKENLTHLFACLGYFRLPGQTERVALVYETPGTDLETLKGLLENPNYEHFNLGARFRLARCLAECVFFLHLTGWLHKGLHSDNVIISGCASDGQGSTGTKALRLYIAGFNASRLDGKGEISEKVELENHIDIYQHPRYQGSMKDRVDYTRQYDIYSLGLLLLELGTWQSIEVGGGFKPKKHDPTRFLGRLLKGPVESLSFTMGNAYKRAVVWCLQGQFEKEEYDFNALEDGEKSMLYWNNVVLELTNSYIDE